MGVAATAHYVVNVGSTHAMRPSSLLESGLAD